MILGSLIFINLFLHTNAHFTTISFNFALTNGIFYFSKLIHNQIPLKYITNQKKKKHSYKTFRKRVQVQKSWSINFNAVFTKKFFLNIKRKASKESNWNCCNNTLQSIAIQNCRKEIKQLKYNGCNPIEYPTVNETRTICINWKWNYRYYNN